MPVRARIALSAIGLAASLLAVDVPAPAEPAGGARLPLSWASSDAVVVEGARVRLQHRWAFRDAATVSMEAENASALALQASRAVGRDPEASGGRYVAFAERLEFVVDVARAGAYQSWTRCFFPIAANWNHTEGTDARQMRPVQDIRPSDADKAGRWVWLKGPAYDLQPGTVYYVFDGYHGGARLDKVVLTRDAAFVPEGAGPAQAGNIARRAGWAESRELRPAAVERWLRLEGAPLPAPGAVKVLLSLEGKPWEPLPADGALPAATASGAGRLRFRLEMAADAAGDPLAEGLQAAYVPRGEGAWGVGNRHLRLRFDPGYGSLAGIENRAPEKPVSCMAAGDPQPLFRVFVQHPEKPDALAPLTSFDADLTGHTLSRDGGRLSMEFALLGGTLRVRCTVAADATPLTRWQIRVDNRSKARVFGVQYPILGNLLLGETGGDDAMVLPWWGAGKRVLNPAAAEWSPWTCVLHYPGSASMQWMDLYDLSGGVSLAACDATGRDLELAYTQNGKQSVNMALMKSLLLPPGHEWSCEYAVGVHPGDWHWAADRYREWARTWLKTPHVPAWVADTDGWAMPSSCANLFGYPTLPLAYQIKAAGQGFRWLQCWMQMTETESCCGQFHYPSPYWGTPEDFRWAIQAIHDQGGRVGFYVNAQLYKPWHNGKAQSIGSVPAALIPPEVLAPYDPGWAFRWQAKDYAGRPYDQPSPNPLADGVRMNPASRGWQEHLLRWAGDWYAGHLGADCIYFDQLSASPSLPVFNDAGTDYGVWGIGYQEMLARLQSRVLPRNPAFVLSMEGASDVHCQQVATALYGTGADLFDVYHYTFPEHILIDYGAYVNQDAFKNPKGLYLNTFLMGTRFTETLPGEFGQNLLALRRRTKSLIHRATYRDTVGVTTDDLEVRAKRFTRDDAHCRAVLVNLGNLGKKSGVTVTADLSPLGRVASAWVFTLDGALRPLRHTTAGGRATFEAPASEAATALFLERIGPLVEQTEFPANTCAGTTVNGAVTVLNLSGRPAAGRVEVLVPKGWSARPAPFGEVAPGGRKRVEVSVTVPAGASRQIHDLSVVARAGATEDTRCVSLAVVPPVEVTSARVLPDGIEAGVRNRGPRTVTASCVLDVFAGAPAPPPQRKELRPGEESVLQFPVAWPDLAAARAPQTVRVIVEAEGLKTARSLAVGPPVVNGSFEGSVVNNDKPEAWPIFGCRADRLHLVSEEPFDGKACLRLDPAPGSPNVAQIVTLQPNTTYRITAAIRCSDARDNAGAVRLVACETPFKQVSTEVRLPAGDPGPAHQWRVVTGTLRTPPQILYSWLYIFNFTRNATVWADGIKVEAVP